MKDSICLVTGASSGLGLAMAHGMAKTGATVVMLCRDEQKGRRARISLIARSGNPNIDLMPCDLSLMEDVRRFAVEFNTFYPRLDVLANIAGIHYPGRKLTAEGKEINLATNLLGPFLLTSLLLEKLADSPSSAIINVSGEAHRKGKTVFDDLPLKRRLTLSSSSYDQMALARLVWTYELAQRLAGTGISANAFCPGWNFTDLQRYYPALLRWPYQRYARLFAHRPEESMRPVIAFTLNEALSGTSGLYLAGGKAVRSSPASYRPTLGLRLWMKLEALTETTGLIHSVLNGARALEY